MIDFKLMKRSRIKEVVLDFNKRTQRAITPIIDVKKFILRENQAVLKDQTVLKDQKRQLNNSISKSSPKKQKQDLYISIDRESKSERDSVLF